MLRADGDKISTTTCRQILKIEYLNPFKQLYLLFLGSKNKSISVGQV